ncbi:hypothetical protein [Peptoclostridium litorale]|nr:hypothetical protein [Peptoclostridium litorale]
MLVISLVTAGCMQSKVEEEKIEDDVTVQTVEQTSPDPLEEESQASEEPSESSDSNVSSTNTDKAPAATAAPVKKSSSVQTDNKSTTNQSPDSNASANRASEEKVADSSKLENKEAVSGDDMAQKRGDIRADLDKQVEDGTLTPEERDQMLEDMKSRKKNRN